MENIMTTYKIGHIPICRGEFNGWDPDPTMAGQSQPTKSNYKNIRRAHNIFRLEVCLCFGTCKALVSLF